MGLLDQAGCERAVFIGHDWGAMLVWHTALLHPDRVMAVAGLSVPPVPRPRSRPTHRWREKFGEDFYLLRFQEHGVADAAMATDVAVGPYREVLFDGAGHWVHQERADDVNRILLEFLDISTAHSTARPTADTTPNGARP